MTDPETYKEWLVRTEPSREFRRRLRARGRVMGVISFLVFAVLALRIGGGLLWWLMVGGLAGVVIYRDVLIQRGAQLKDRRVVALNATVLVAVLAAAMGLPWPFSPIAIAAVLALDWVSETSAVRNPRPNRLTEIRATRGRSGRLMLVIRPYHHSP